MIAVEAGKPEKILGFGTHHPNTVVTIKTAFISEQEARQQEDCIKALIRGVGLQMMARGASSMIVVVEKSEPHMEKACEYYGGRLLNLGYPPLVEIKNFKKNFQRFDADNRYPS